MFLLHLFYMNSINSKSKRKKIIIYCRVSTKEQADEGNSLLTQEKACKELAYKLGFSIDDIEIFIERGESAKTADRTELKKMFSYCAKKNDEESILIIYKVDRLSRSVADYAQIKLLLEKYNVTIKSVMEQIEDTPIGRFLENTMVNVAQFDNDIRAMRCTDGMKDAVREGRYVWGAPLGYKNGIVNGKSNLIPDETAPMIVDIFKTVAKGLSDINHIWKEATKNGLRSKKGEKISRSYFYKVLKNKVFCGIIEKFGEQHPGTFEPLISVELFDCVQKVLQRRSKTMTAYKTDHPDFPLRRFVFSKEGLKMTGSWSKGRRGKKYAFYRFGMKGSNYQKDSLEKDFVIFAEQFKFDEEKIAKLKVFIKQKFEKATSAMRTDTAKLQRRLIELQDLKSSLIQKNFKGIIDDDTLKEQLDLSKEEIISINAKLYESENSNLNINEMLNYAEQYLKSPGAFWEKKDVETKLALQWFQFPSGVVFDGEKFGTAQISSLFKTKDAFDASLSPDVDPSGLEPLTSSVQVRRSTR